MSIDKKWKMEREYWGLWLSREEAYAKDQYGAPIGFESVEEAKDYAKDKGLFTSDDQLATTPNEAERGGDIRVVIVPIRVFTRSL